MKPLFKYKLGNGIDDNVDIIDMDWNNVNYCCNNITGNTKINTELINGLYMKYFMINGKKIYLNSKMYRYLRENKLLN